MCFNVSFRLLWAQVGDVKIMLGYTSIAKAEYKCTRPRRKSAQLKKHLKLFWKRRWSSDGAATSYNIFYGGM